MNQQGNQLSAGLAEVLQRLRHTAAVLAELDFGYPTDPPRFRPPATEERIADLTASAGAPIPDDYEEFLREHAGFVAMDVHNGYDVFSPDDVLRLSKQAWQPHHVAVDGVRRAVLAIAGDGGGNLFLLESARPWRVWKWNHELGSGRDTIDGSARELEEVARGFTAFLAAIAEDWERFADGDTNWIYLS
jgi:hypothetical protein